MTSPLGATSSRRPKSSADGAPTDVRRTRELAQKALDIDSDYAAAWALLAASYWYASRLAVDTNADELIAKARKCTGQALEIDSTNVYALGLDALTSLAEGTAEEGVEKSASGIALNPGSADMRAYRGFCLLCAGKPEEAVAELEIAMRLNPHPPVRYCAVLARARDAEGALEVVTGVLAREADNFPSALHATTLFARCGRKEEAKSAAREVLCMVPDFRIKQVNQWLLMRDSEFTDAFRDGLRKAGMPE